jgi:hypothetical protein
VSSAVPPVPPVPAPIEPARSGGIWRKVLIGCGIAALLIVVCFVGLVLYLKQRPETVTDVVMNQVESHYASDVTPQDKEELRSAYRDFRKAVQEHRISREPLQRIRTTLIAGSQNEISRQQVRDLAEVFRQAAGGTAATSGASPSPAVATPSPRPSP